MNIIPLEKLSSQEFRMPLENTFYRWRVRWNSRTKYFSFDLYDDDSNPLLLGVPMLKGANLLNAFQDIPIGGLFMITTDEEEGEATLENIGESVNLVHLTQQEIQDIQNGETV